MNYLNLSLMAFLLSSTVIAQSPCLIASYPFDGNANDMTGNGHDGTVHGAVLATDRFGEPNNCYQFDGIDDFIQLAGSFNSAQGTVSAWVYIDDFQDLRPILAQRDTEYNGIATSFSINSDGPQDTKLFYKETDRRDCPGGTGQLYFTNADPMLEDSVWTQLTATSDGNQVRLYMNCVEVTTYMSGGGSEDPGYWFSDMCMNPTTWIGAEKRQSDQWYFKGRIDDVKIFDCALTGAQIDSLCQTQTSTTVPEVNKTMHIAVYPNPSTGVVTISGSSVKTEPTVRVTDMTGRSLKASFRMVGDDIVLDLSSAPAGPYLVWVDGRMLHVARE